MERDAEAVTRLAEQAKANGVRTYAHHLTYVATSKCQPGELHRVTARSRDRQSYPFRGGCQHHGALLDHVGELPAADASALVAKEEGDARGLGNPETI